MRTNDTPAGRIVRRIMWGLIIAAVFLAWCQWYEAGAWGAPDARAHVEYPRR